MLLFGDYPWNQRVSKLEDSVDHLSFAERLKLENGREWWIEERVELPERVERVKNWEEVVNWVERNRDLV